jgi:hypothetical protein
MLDSLQAEALHHAQPARLVIFLHQGLVRATRCVCPCPQIHASCVHRVFTHLVWSTCSRVRLFTCPMISTKYLTAYVHVAVPEGKPMDYSSSRLRAGLLLSCLTQTLLVFLLLRVSDPPCTMHTMGYVCLFSRAARHVISNHLFAFAFAVPCWKFHKPRWSHRLHSGTCTRLMPCICLGHQVTCLCV